jgi:hypothetical protein
MFQDWRTRNREYGVQATQFVRNFAAEIAEQIGAPDTFTMHEQNEKVQYVRALTFDSETGAFDLLGFASESDQPADIARGRLSANSDNGASLFDDRVGTQQENFRDTEPERLRRL